MTDLGTLYVVGTPIGNLEDLSLRAARVLREADLIAAEDTRSAKTLLAHADALGPVNPSRRIVSLFEGNEAERSEELVECPARGPAVAVISEAGMPGVSDPGARAVAAAVDRGARASRSSPVRRAALAALVGIGAADATGSCSSAFRRASRARAARCSARCATRSPR